MGRRSTGYPWGWGCWRSCVCLRFPSSTLANDPQVILADEPTGNLDSETRQQVMDYLTEFHDDGRTIVMVTHDQEVAAFAHRTIRLVSGIAKDIAVPEAA